MQRNVPDLIGRLVTRVRRQVAAWGAIEDLGMCLLAIGLMLLPAFVSAHDGGRFSHRAAAAIAVPGTGECSADARGLREPRRGAQAPPGRTELGMRKLASVLCEGRSRVVRAAPLLMPSTLAPVLARFDIDPQAPSALLALLAGFVAAGAYAFTAAAGLLGLVKRGRAGGVPPRDSI